MLRILLSKSYESGVNNLLETYYWLHLVYEVFKVHYWEIIGIVASALIIRFFAEGTFTIDIIGAMMGKRFTSNVTE